MATYDSRTALLLVDVQIDFCPGGALPVPDGDAVVPVLNAEIADAVTAGSPVIASRDWHPVAHCSFAAEGGPWPPHCIQDTDGARFHPGLALPADAVRVSKGGAFDRDAYSAFDGTGLASHLHSRGITRLVIGGLALDVCVRATILDACAAGFETTLLGNASRPVDPAAGERVLSELAAAGATIA